MNDKRELIIEKLKDVYDPEFPVVDIYTLGLIYDVNVNLDIKSVFVLMTLTTPACPLADIIKEMVKNAVIEVVPDFFVNIKITFDPMRTMDSIKDPDVKRMFE